MEKITIKNKWSEIDLNTYVKISEIQTNENLEHLNLQKAVELIAVLSDRPLKEILQYDKEMLGVCLEKIAFIFDDNVEDRSKEIIIIDGQKYIFEPNLDGLTTGEMISIEQLILNAGNTGQNYLAELLAILIRPAIPIEGKENDYKIEPFEAETVQSRKELFNTKLFVPFFLQNLTTFFFGSKQLGSISRLFSEMANDTKANLKRLVN